MQIKYQYLPKFLYIYKICKSYEIDYTVKNIVEECRKYENMRIKHHKITYDIS